MLPGLGGMNPRQLQQMMKQFGMKSDEIDVKRVIFELEGKKLVINAPKVTQIEMQGMKTYQVIGDAIEEIQISEEDIKLVSEQAKVSMDDAKKALEETNGDIAEAISKLSG